MIAVSEQIKEAFNPNAGRGDRRIDWYVIFNFANAAANRQMTVSDYSAEDTLVSRAAQMKDGDNRPLNMATFEGGGFPLDGSVQVAARTDEAADAQVGYYSEQMSDANGDLAEPVSITIQGTASYNILAFTITWGAAIPEQFGVEWFNTEGSLIAQESISDNVDAESVVRYAQRDVNKIVITVSKMRDPWRRVRFAEFSTGVAITYNKDNSTKMSIHEETDPLNERVSANTLAVSVDNFARDFNIFDPTSIYEYFQDRMLMRPYIGAMVAEGAYNYVDMGYYYLQAPKLKGDMSIIELDAINAIGLLQNTLYNRGTFKTASLAAFVEDIAADADVNIIYPESFRTTVVPGYFASQAHILCLRQIAQATNTVLRTTRTDEIEFLKPGNDPLFALGKDDYRMNGGFSPSDEDVVNTVNVDSTAFDLSATIEKLTEIDAPASAVAHAVFRVDNAILTLANGEEIAVKYDLSCEQSYVVAEGKLLINGRKIKRNVSVVTAQKKQTYEQAYPYSIQNNPFIQAQNAQAVAEHLLEMKARKRRTVKVNYRGYPYIEVGDAHNYDTGDFVTQPFMVTQTQYELAGGMTATLEGRER